MIIAIGVDVGLTGSIAARGDGFTACVPFKSKDGTVNFHPISDFLKALQDFKLIAFVEAVHATPQMGVSSAFTFGRTCGHLEGFLIGRGIPVRRVRPQAWQKEMHRGVEPTADAKARSLDAVKNLFPEVNLLETPRCKTPHKGMIDALLIAEYGWRTISAEAEQASSSPDQRKPDCDTSHRQT